MDRVNKLKRFRLICRFAVSTVFSLVLGLTVDSLAEPVTQAIDVARSYEAGRFKVTYQPRIVTAETPSTNGSYNIATAGTPAFGVDHEGVAQLQIDVHPAPNFFGVCTGSLLSNGVHLLTAAHCVSDDSGDNAVLDTGKDGNFAYFGTATGVVTRQFTSADVSIHPTFDGDVLHGYDVAIIDLGTPLPITVLRYDLVSAGGSDIGVDGIKVGYGRGGHGDTGDTVPITLPFPSTKRFGKNEYEAIGLGAAPFSVGGITNNDTQLTYDFDNGMAANDAFGTFFGAPYADAVGFGEDEANSAPGDSGGPTFVDEGGTMKIAGVTSYGVVLSAGGLTSDILPGLNSSFGEFSVDARVSNIDIHNFITAATIPEPGSWLLMFVFLGGIVGYSQIKSQRPVLKQSTFLRLRKLDIAPGMRGSATR